MHKTTVYLPDELKARLAGEARRQGVSEAELIRAAIQASVARPRPGRALFRAEPFAERVDELLEGFGEQ